MDPNEALASMRLHLSAADRASTSGEMRWELEQAAEYARALDEWLSRGGFLPNAWQAGR